MKMMTRENIENEMEMCMVLEKKSMEEDGSILPKVLMFCGDGGTEISIFGIDPAVMSSATSKNSLAAMLEDECRKRKAQLVIFVSDMWCGTESIEELAAHRKMEALLGRSIGVQEAHGLGLARDFHETIMVVAHSPVGQIRYSQPYKRDGKKIVWMEASKGDEPLEGRFSNYFRWRNQDTQ